MIRGRKQLAKRWYPKRPGEADEVWLRRALNGLERVVTRHRATLANLTIPDYIRASWAKRLPKNKFGEYEMTEWQADSYYREHANQPRDEYMSRGERGVYRPRDWEG